MCVSGDSCQYKTSTSSNSNSLDNDGTPQTHPQSPERKTVPQPPPSRPPLPHPSRAWPAALPWPRSNRAHPAQWPQSCRGRRRQFPPCAGNLGPAASWSGRMCPAAAAFSVVTCLIPDVNVMCCGFSLLSVTQTHTDSISLPPLFSRAPSLSLGNASRWPQFRSDSLISL